MLDAAEQDCHIGVVPRDRQLQLHQEELTIDARIGPIDDSLRKVDARVARLPLVEDDQKNPAQDLEEPGTSTHEKLLSITSVDGRRRTRPTPATRRLAQSSLPRCVRVRPRPSRSPSTNSTRS